VDWFAYVPQWFWLAFAFVFGAAVGSFLNVCIHRIPRGEEVVRTPSHCPACGQRIPWYHNIPILSWLILRGRAACCRAPIKFRYFLIELLSACLTAYIFHLYGLTLEFLSAWVFTCFMLVLAATDWETWRLPDVLTIPGALLGLVFAAFSVRIDIFNSFIGLLVGAGGFLAIALIYRLARGIEGMGGGDVKLMAMVGSFLGWLQTLLVAVLGSILALIFSVFTILRSSEGGKTKIRHGTYICLAAIIVLLWGDSILRWYINLIKGHPLQ
jgi:leader peptidase (prepilin peptidase)/N-methyltransferase